MAEEKQNSDQNRKPFNGNIPKLKNPKFKFNFYWIYGILAVIFTFLYFSNMGTSPKTVGWGELKTMLVSQHVEKILLVNKEQAEIYIKKDSLSLSKYKDLKPGNSLSSPSPQYTYQIGSVETFEKDIQEAQKDLTNPVYIQNVTRKNWGSDLLWGILPFVVLIAGWFIIMRMMSRGSGGGGGQIFNIGKSKAQLFDRDTMVTTNFSDVAGLEEAKVEIMEIVEFLKNPKKYTELGGKIPKGALLVGPPGTGKTLLAKAVAGEAKVPFFSLSGSDFVEMFVGVGASRVRDLFKQAKDKAPCIIFIDEIDAIGRARGRNPMTGSNDERENTLNQLLTEMDGFQTNAGVIILAATNRADILDRALLRAGRFDRQIHVELPDLEERKAIFKVHMRNLKLDEGVNVDFLARQTPGFSGADIANVCNESALIAARNDKKKIDKQDFLDAIDRIIGGLEKRNKIISPYEKKVIAYHESGHAAVSWLVEHANPLVKVTIVPRGKALGAAWYLPEERQITTFEQMYDEITAALGGRASEEVVFGKVSTGALNDLEKVTKQAYAMVAYYGLNDKIGNISYYDSTGQQEYMLTKPFSEQTAEVIDEEISKMIESAYDKAKKLLRDNREKLDELANKLLQKEVIFREDLVHIFGERAFDTHEHVIFNGNGESEPETAKQTEDQPAETAPEITAETTAKTSADNPETDDRDAEELKNS
ncbi:MAG TPA: ATP-dependent zinc metalloprotease FtsH [Bacteroidales bacterium]|jgi:cell division protease FtsH|nr:ATP-dependent zinc metalloprotease FtsH [Bacteroidales bacterium]